MARRAGAVSKTRAGDARFREAGPQGARRRALRSPRGGSAGGRGDGTCDPAELPVSGLRRPPRAAARRLEHEPAPCAPRWRRSPATRCLALRQAQAPTRESSGRVAKYASDSAALTFSTAFDANDALELDQWNWRMRIGRDLPARGFRSWCTRPGPFIDARRTIRVEAGRRRRRSPASSRSARQAGRNRLVEPGLNCCSGSAADADSSSSATQALAQRAIGHAPVETAPRCGPCGMRSTRAATRSRHGVGPWEARRPAYVDLPLPQSTSLFILGSWQRSPVIVLAAGKARFDGAGPSWRSRSAY